MAQLFQGSLPAGMAGTIQRHGTHPRLHDPPAPLRRPSLRLGAAEPARINRSFPQSDLPDTARHLKWRALPAIRRSGAGSCHPTPVETAAEPLVLEFAVRIADVDPAFAVIRGSPSPAAPPGALNADRADRRQVFLYFRTNDAGFIAPLIHGTHFDVQVCLLYIIPSDFTISLRLIFVQWILRMVQKLKVQNAEYLTCKSRNDLPSVRTSPCGERKLAAEPRRNTASP